MSKFKDTALEQMSLPGTPPQPLPAERTKADKPATAIEIISEIAGRPITAADYWPEKMGVPVEKVLEMLGKEADALRQLEKMGRYGITLRDKVIFYFSVLHFLCETEQVEMDKPITWAEFKRLIGKSLLEYAQGRTCHD